MKKWTTPMAMEECFTANVDVAVTTCYKVACDAKAANAYEERHPFWGVYPPNHTGDNCTYYENNVIQIDSNTHKITGMIGKYKYGDVQCQFTTPDYQTINPGGLEVGTRVYWTHKYVGTLQHHHQGNLELTDPDKKCMS